MRSLEALTSPDDPAWPEIQRWIADSPRSAEVLPLATADKGRCLYKLQVTTRSPLGALAWETGGLLLDDGWLRVLGGGTATLADIATSSGVGDPAMTSAPPPFLVVGHDVLGGRFAVNGGGLPVEPGETAYFAPDSLAWEGMGFGHGAFLEWALTGDTDPFYASLRWPGWRAEVSAVRPDQGLSVYPPLYTAEGAQNIASTSRRPVPWTEILAISEEVSEQLAETQDGTAVTIKVTEAAPKGLSDRE